MKQSCMIVLSGNRHFQMCGVSVNEDPMQLIKALHIPNPGRPTLGIVRGIMKCQYGPADFKREKHIIIGIYSKIKLIQLAVNSKS